MRSFGKRLACATIGVLCAAILLAGCHRGPSMDGDWAVFAASSKSPIGSFTFSGDTFSQSANLAGIIATSGTYVLDDKALHLAPSTGAGPSAEPKDFAVDWKGNNLVYLSYSRPGIQLVLALARSGAQPDAHRLVMNLDASKMNVADRGKWAGASLAGFSSLTTDALPKTAPQQQALPLSDTIADSSSQPKAPEADEGDGQQEDSQQGNDFQQPDQQDAQPADQASQPAAQPNAQPNALPDQLPSDGGNGQGQPQDQGAQSQDQQPLNPQNQDQFPTVRDTGNR